MELYEFLLLNEEDQWEFLLYYHYIGTREDSENKYFLYQIDGFYVEIKFTNYNHKVQLNAFATTFF
jgi:hypothetical protein